VRRPSPPNYREQIDADFARTLKDPDSRKIVYQGNPYGSLVCGTVNARNSFGGYVGQQLFSAYCSPAGTLATVRVFAPGGHQCHPSAASGASVPDRGDLS
jgi:hypothetical protein